jgi:hypothetical protein
VILVERQLLVRRSRQHAAAPPLALLSDASHGSLKGGSPANDKAPANDIDSHSEKDDGYFSPLVQRRPGRGAAALHEFALT